MKWLFPFLVLLALIEASDGATWYSSSTGTSTLGTSASPWSVPFAVTNTNPYLQPGDTVLFKSGTFTCTETSPLLTTYGNLLVFRKAGLPSAKITYRSENLWQFNFNGGLMIPQAASNIVVRDFHIYFSGATNRNVTNYLTYAMGIDAFAVGSDIMHNLIENTGHPGIGSWSSTEGKYIAGNIIRFCGFNDYAVGGGTPAGSAMYLQQAAYLPEALIQGNITYYNYTTGMKAYGNDNINGFNFNHNITAINGLSGIFYHEDQVDSQGVKILTNYLWTSGIAIGYSLGNANSSNAVVVGNYSAGNDHDGVFFMEDGWKDCTITNNTFINTDYRYMMNLDASGQTNFVATHTWDYNTYYGASTNGYGIWNFRVGSDVYLFPGWTNRIHGDTHSSLLSSPPPATETFVFAPSSDPSFVHVAVFNWETNATVTVDLSPYYRLCDVLNIYDTQAIPVAYTNFHFAGSTVVLDLTRTNIAPMLGTFSQRPDAWSGFDPRFRSFVIYRQPVL